MILSPLIPIDPGVYLLIQPVGGDGCSIDTDIDGKSILLALQAHNQKTDEYDGKKNQNQNKIISFFFDFINKCLRSIRVNQFIIIRDKISINAIHRIDEFQTLIQSHRETGRAEYIAVH